MARVLVVDDENLMRTMVEVACRRLGHEALCAATLVRNVMITYWAKTR